MAGSAKREDAATKLQTGSRSDAGRAPVIGAHRARHRPSDPESLSSGRSSCWIGRARHLVTASKRPAAGANSGLAERRQLRARGWRARVRTSPPATGRVNQIFRWLCGLSTACCPRAPFRYHLPCPAFFTCTRHADSIPCRPFGPQLLCTGMSPASADGRPTAEVFSCYF